MKYLWRSVTGRNWLKNVEVLLRNQKHRLLIVTGGYDMVILFNLCTQRKLTGEVTLIKTPDDLWNLPVDEDNHIVFLESLIYQSRMDLNQCYDLTRKFCRQYSYDLILAPYDISCFDLDSLRQELFSLVNDTCCARLMYEIIISISAGIPLCFDIFARDYIRQFSISPGTFPVAEKCMNAYIADMKKNAFVERIYKEWLLTGYIAKIVSSQNSYEDDWILLWSVGLAIKVDGRWALSPVLLSGKGLIREKARRIQDANDHFITPLYMAWVYYCERKYDLIEGQLDSLTYHRPKDILDELNGISSCSEDDRQLSKRVRDLRNWLQHGDNIERSFQNSVSAHETGRRIFDLLTLDGYKRKNKPEFTPNPDK